MRTREQANRFRFRGDQRGHYESCFQRANHPSRPLAFWIRYTMFAPRSARGDALGQLWAIYFDGERDRITAVKQSLPYADCRFASCPLDVRIGAATLGAEALSGTAHTGHDRIDWSLTFSSPAPPLYLLPPALYEAALPKAKALVGSPLARYRGTLTVNGEPIAIDDWVGSQNHNWGTKHTDRYAWAQVAGFDESPDTFLECATASLRLGPLWTPALSPIVLRHEGQELRLNSLQQSLRAHASYDFRRWELRSRNDDCEVEIELGARPQDFVGLRYENPPGGLKTCLNTKLASASLTLRRKGQSPLHLRSAHRAAFEILTDDGGHGVRVLEA